MIKHCAQPGFLLFASFLKSAVLKAHHKSHDLSLANDDLMEWFKGYQ